jgi:hypothetical protein
MGAKRIEFKNDVDPGSFAGFEACVEAVVACTDDDNLIIKSQTCFPRPRFEKAIFKICLAPRIVKDIQLDKTWAQENNEYGLIFEGNNPAPRLYINWDGP